MNAVFVGGKRVALDPSRVIGQGGEAAVYDAGGVALKVYKEPGHPDYQGDPHAQKGAAERIAIHQRKLPAFPKNLPSRVVAPIELATDGSRRRIVGYTMAFLKDAEVLMRYADRSFRQAGIESDRVVAIFRDLHGTVQQLHRAGAVIGDFNDLNVLVKGSEAYLIDADSFQFQAGPSLRGGAPEEFFCQTFTAKFVDPLRCEPHASALVLVQPHTGDTDWYAYSVLLMQSLLYVDPYGGVYRPKDPGQRVPHDARPLHRITVFHPEVRYPKPAVPYGVLPDGLLQWFHQVFEKDRRGEFPRALLDGMRWTTCAQCGAEHARDRCPTCATVAPGVVREVTTVRGTVTATRVFRTEGLIVFAAHHGGKLLWLSHERNAFYREDGSRVATGRLGPGMRFRLRGSETLIGQGGRLVTLAPGKAPEQTTVDSFGTLPVFDTNERFTYWLRGGQLRRTAPLGEAYLGDVLAGQTLFWAGPEFGFGFYRAGELRVEFVFDTANPGINDRVAIPPIRGQLIDSSCQFGRGRCWFFVATREGGKTIHQCVLLRTDGTVEATAQAEAGDNSWLGSLRGKCAVGSFLLAATDEGAVRVEADAGQIRVSREFPDTEPFVDSQCHLFPGPDGIYVVGPHDIRLLKMD